MMQRKTVSGVVSLLLMAVFVILGVVFGVYQLFAYKALSRGLLGIASIAFLAVPITLPRLGLSHPHRLYCLFFAFCIMAYDFGCVWQGFDRYDYFDKISHFLSGIVFTILGFCIYLYLNRPRPEKLDGNPAISCTYAVFFSVFVAVVWEICEFTGFVTTGHDSQHTLTTGVFDTMQDLIACLLGSLLSAGSFILYIKKKIVLITGFVLEEFFILNQKRP